MTINSLTHLVVVAIRHTNVRYHGKSLIITNVSLPTNPIDGAKAGANPQIEAVAQNQSLPFLLGMQHAPSQYILHCNTFCGFKILWHRVA